MKIALKDICVLLEYIFDFICSLKGIYVYCVSHVLYLLQLKWL